MVFPIHHDTDSYKNKHILILRRKKERVTEFCLISVIEKTNIFFRKTLHRRVCFAWKSKHTAHRENWIDTEYIVSVCGVQTFW